MRNIKATCDAQDRLLRYSDTNVRRMEYKYDSLGALARAVRTSQDATTGEVATNTFDYSNDGFGRRVERFKNGELQERYVYDNQGRDREHLLPLRIFKHVKIVELAEFLFQLKR